ncbi:succinate dehydrogenase, hydrophobic membrane anchor protein [Frigoribacterium sp. CFBP9039]|uniref:succinate dehydrogenase, hydrophobic membrane anchor protein n=1 Tax=Frigoribacterium TaxID=96492 RepID=UPI00177C8D5C|nr:MULTISPECIES: succinate dehydrogenase, hydrophobic membrane anchor protein [Frigoribacterium]MBD8702515.1 succinate dehydrogenase, hydrophobic membrane anchor protein [Frigoribacterium sp. CFBP 13712]MCJ0699794.1 succinate dehydrogenase, hydrophobic membrane anchor protein [Frigoribacterium faeni]MDY0891199.1 succinate dehydrogenase, hydrophobic membrane anchor protein [Frigoribacterium sp. CFBP9030]MDY0944500.1 succinate dehydrogenase, hydrophobic membrane anchor protein [Frigoribacterium s
MTTETIEAPRSARPASRSSNLEKWGWIYMRASGVVLVVLIFGHLFINLLAAEGGIKAIDFAFVAGKWASPFWQVYDTLLLWLALIHGSNGMRTIVNDYVSKPAVRKVLLGALLVSAVVLLTLGTLVIYTFDPCPAGAPADLLPSICS